MNILIVLSLSPFVADSSVGGLRLLGWTKLVRGEISETFYGFLDAMAKRKVFSLAGFPKVGQQWLCFSLNSTIRTHPPKPRIGIGRMFDRFAVSPQDTRSKSQSWSLFLAMKLWAHPCSSTKGLSA